jgi:hypothetical protein
VDNFPSLVQSYAIALIDSQRMIARFQLDKRTQVAASEVRLGLLDTLHIFDCERRLCASDGIVRFFEYQRQAPGARKKVARGQVRRARR